MTLYDIGIINFLMNASLRDIQQWFRGEYDSEYAMQMIHLAQDRNIAILLS